jgi:para-aminobenzoate synthetase / 4-amino-4-deoxychorismate lyase
LPERPVAGDPQPGVFETLLARDGRLQALGAHLGRLARSASELYGTTLPPGLSGELRRRVHGLPGERRLRVDARPGGPGLSIEIQVSELPADRHAPVRCAAVEVAGGLGRHKLSDRRRIDQLGAAAGGPGSSALTVLIADRDGELLEASWGNLWLIDGAHLVTPPADGRLLPGITRRLLLQVSRGLGLEPREESISLSRARSADAVLLTSSLRHCVAAQLEGGPADTAPAEAAAARIRVALHGLAWE